MARLFMLPSRIPATGSYARENQRQKRPQHVEDMFRSTRNASDYSASTSPASPASPPPTHRHSSFIAPSTISTRSLSTSAPVDAIPLPDQDIMIVPVKLSNPFRRFSIDGAAELPERPRPRSFLGKVRTRVGWDHAREKEERYKAVKMPRSEYRKWFRRDGEGRYMGTEEEREWDEEGIRDFFGRWQDMPLRTSVIC